MIDPSDEREYERLKRIDKRVVVIADNVTSGDYIGKHGSLVGYCACGCGAPLVNIDGLSDEQNPIMFGKDEVAEEGVTP